MPANEVLHSEFDSKTRQIGRAWMSFYLGGSNVENVCNLYRIVVTIEPGPVHPVLRLFVQRAATPRTFLAATGV